MIRFPAIFLDGHIKDQGIQRQTESGLSGQDAVSPCYQGRIGSNTHAPACASNQPTSYQSNSKEELRLLYTHRGIIGALCKT